MPAMPRLKDKATRIAYNLIGVPANMKKRRGRPKKRRVSEVEERILNQADRQY